MAKNRRTTRQGSATPDPALMQAILTAPKRLHEGVDYSVDRLNRGQWHEWEQKVLEHLQQDTTLADSCLRYAREVIRGRWPELEERLLRNPYLLKYLVGYVKSGVIKSPCPTLEFRLLTNAHASTLALVYARWIITVPWAKGEKVLLEDITDETRSLLCEDISGTYPVDEVCVTEYARSVHGGPWPELEKKIVAGECTLRVAVDYTEKVRGKPWAAVETILLRFCPSCNIDFRYFEKAFGQYVKAFSGRIPHMRRIVLNGNCHPLVALGFASATLKRRSTPFETMLLGMPHSDDLFTAVIEYNKRFIQGRWKQAEPVLSSSYEYLFRYADEILGARLPTHLHNEMVVQSFALPNDQWIRQYIKKYGV